MADRKISQMTPASAAEVTDLSQFLIADLAGVGPLGNRSLSKLEAKRTLALGTDALARASAVEGLQVQIDALASGMLIVGDWDAGTGAFPTTRPDGSPIQSGDAWVVSGGGTVDGITFDVADHLVALVDGGGATYDQNWVRSPHGVDLKYDFETKPAFIGAVIPPEILVVRVLNVGQVLTYIRDFAGMTVHSDGSHWRLAGGAHYSSPTVMIADSYAFDLGDRVTAGAVTAPHGYDVVAADVDVTTAGGVLLRVRPDITGRYHLDAFGAAGDGVTDDTAVLTKAISRGKVLLGPGVYAVNEVQPVTGMDILGARVSGVWPSSALVCNVPNGAVFRDAGVGAISNVRLNGVGGDAGAAGVVFWDSPMQTKYSSMYRFTNLELSSNFKLLFRAIPIYWRIDDCRFGFHGNRRGGTQEFRVLEAWSASSACPINFNKTVNTTHYHCAAGAEYVAAYTLRYGRGWVFEDCSAELFDSAAIVDAAEFAGVRWVGGWQEHISYQYAFRLRRDNTAPTTINPTPTMVENAEIYVGSSTQQYLIENAGGRAGARGNTISGSLTGFQVFSAPSLVSDYEVNYAQGVFVHDRINIAGQVYQGRITPYRNGCAPAVLTVVSTGTAPTLTEVTSGFSGEQTSSVLIGNGSQVLIRNLGISLMTPFRGAYATLVLVGFASGTLSGMIRACYWANQATPTYANITGQASDARSIGPSAGGALAFSRAGVLVPSSVTNFHVGLILPAADSGMTFRVEGLHLLLGDQIVEFPFFV